LIVAVSDARDQWTDQVIDGSKHSW